MTENKIHILFVCVHNSARSQMAEDFANRAGKGRIAAQSAGLEAGTLNPLVVESMREIGIDISGHRTKTVHDILRTGTKYDYVITVCDAGRAQTCPVFPGPAKRHHWDFPDPSSFRGSPDEVLAQIRPVREDIQLRVKRFIAEILGESSG